MAVRVLDTRRKVTSFMYEYLTRSEVVRLAWRVACLAVACLCSIVAGLASLGSIWGLFDAPGYLVPDGLKVARLGCLALCIVAGVGGWYGIGDALRCGAWLSFQRSLRMKGGK